MGSYAEPDDMFRSSRPRPYLSSASSPVGKSRRNEVGKGVSKLIGSPVTG